MENLKLSYELDRLNDIVEERHRLISVLGINPSTRDNVNLKKQLSKTLDLLNEYANYAEETESLGKFASQYSEILKNISSDAINVSLYEFQLPIKVQSTNFPLERSNSSDLSLSRELPKKVRFKDEGLVTYSDSKQFKPYHDDVSPERASSDSDTASETDRKKLFPASPDPEMLTHDHNIISPGISNQEIFIQQQQQLLEQDSYLNSLSSSVHRSHNISLDINNEVTEQNDHVLQDLESLVDNSGRNLDRAKRRLEVFEKTARENGPCFIIVILTIILVLLLIVL